MKSLFTLLFVALSFGLFAQSQKNIDKEIETAIDELSETLKTLDFSQLLNEELFGKIEELKPSDSEIQEMQGMMIEGLSAMKEIDFSAFEDIFKEFDKAFKDMDIAPLDSPATKSDKKKKQKGKRI